jgi:hypothetical protein
MSKRAQDNDEDMREAKSAFNVGDRVTVEDEGMGEFEDPWEDEVESDQEVIIENDDDDEGIIHIWQSLFSIAPVTLYLLFMVLGKEWFICRLVYELSLVSAKSTHHS